MCKPPSVTRLWEMYRLIRVRVETILHRQLFKADASLYASCRHGGLGIPSMEWVVTVAALKNGINFLSSQDTYSCAFPLFQTGGET